MTGAAGMPSHARQAGCREGTLPVLELKETHRLYYTCIRGRRAGPYLVFLHEGLGCVGMWKSFPELVCAATGCPGLVYDRLGYGKSSPLTSSRTIHYMHEYALQELPALLRAVIPDAPYILIGHSDGGSISLIQGAERSSELKGIITEAAHVFVEPVTIAGIKDAETAWLRGELRGLGKYHGDKTETVFTAWSATWLSSWFRFWNIEYLLPSIEVPLLVIQGENDRYGSLEQVRAITAKSSGATYAKIIENCGHTPHRERSQLTMELMADFILQICNR